jgi:hypothetical protein
MPKKIFNNSDPLLALPMLILKRRMSTIKQHDKGDNVYQRSSSTLKLFKNSSLRNVIKNIFNIDLHHNLIKCRSKKALMQKGMVSQPLGVDTLN